MPKALKTGFWNVKSMVGHRVLHSASSNSVVFDCACERSELRALLPGKREEGLRTRPFSRLIIADVTPGSVGLSFDSVEIWPPTSETRTSSSIWVFLFLFDIDICSQPEK